MITRTGLWLCGRALLQVDVLCWVIGKPTSQPASKAHDMCFIHRVRLLLSITAQATCVLLQTISCYHPVPRYTKVTVLLHGGEGATPGFLLGRPAPDRSLRGPGAAAVVCGTRGKAVGDGGTVPPQPASPVASLSKPVALRSGLTSPLPLNPCMSQNKTYCRGLASSTGANRQREYP